MKDSSIQLREVRRMLANVPGLLGVGCGLKETAGKLTPETAWRVYVTKKKPRGCLQLNGRIPHSLLGLPTDVIEREPTLVSSCEGLLDSSDGTMIANKKGVPGTLGCWARYVATGQLVLLSNYHVLFGKKCKQGDTIWRVHRWGAEYDYQSIGKNLVGKASTITFRGIDYFIDAAIGELNEA